METLGTVGVEIIADANKATASIQKFTAEMGLMGKEVEKAGGLLEKGLKAGFDETETAALHLAKAIDSANAVIQKSINKTARVQEEALQESAVLYGASVHDAETHADAIVRFQQREDAALEKSKAKRKQILLDAVADTRKMKREAQAAARATDGKGGEIDGVRSASILSASKAARAARIAQAQQAIKQEGALLSLAQTHNGTRFLRETKRIDEAEATQKRQAHQRQMADEKSFARDEDKVFREQSDRRRKAADAHDNVNKGLRDSGNISAQEYRDRRTAQISQVISDPHVTDTERSLAYAEAGKLEKERIKEGQKLTQSEINAQRAEKAELHSVMESLKRKEVADIKADAEATMAADKAGKTARIREAKQESFVMRQEMAAIRLKESAEAKAEREKETVGRRLLNSGYGISRAGDEVGMVGLFAAAPIVAATVAASAFQTEFLKAANNTDLTVEQIKVLRESMKQLVREGTNQPLDKLFAAGMRAENFRKPGQTAADTLSIVRIGTQAASATFADAEKTTEALAREMYLFNVPVKEAAPLMNSLEVAAAHFNLKLEDMVKNSGRLLSGAAELKIPLNEVVASFAALTKAGFSASQATTSMRSVIHALTDPTDKQKKAIQDLTKASGVDVQKAFGTHNVAVNGLIGSYEILRKALKGNKQALVELFPDYRQNSALLNILGEQYGSITTGIGKMNTAWKDNSRYQTNLHEVQKTSQYQLDQMKNKLLLLADGLSKYLLPGVNKLIAAVNGWIDAFEKLDPHTKETIVTVTEVSAALLLVFGGSLKLIGGLVQLVKGIKDVIAIFGEMRAAAVLAEASEVGLAATGTAAFAATAPYLIAIGLVAAAIYGIVRAFGAASDAQDKFAAKRAADAAFINTGDQRTNIDHQAQVNRAQLSKEQAGLARSKKELGWLTSSKVPLGEHVGFANGYLPNTQADAISHKRAEVKAQEGHIAALVASTAALAKDSGQLGNLTNLRLNLQRTIADSQKEEAANADRARSLRAVLALGAKSVHQGQGSFNPNAAAIQGRLGSLGIQGGLPQAQSELDALVARNNALARDRKGHERELPGVVKRESAEAKSGMARAGQSIASAIGGVDPRKIVTTVSESCAEFVSKLFQQAGMALPTIFRAKDLRQKVLDMGGVSHQGPALAGDLVVYHGGRMGTKAGGGYHVAAADGPDSDWESSKGRTKHSSISGNMKWSGPGTTVEYITPGGRVPDGYVGPRYPGMPSPMNNQGGELTDWMHGKKKASSGAAGGAMYKPYVVPPYDADLAQANYMEGKIGKADSAMQSAAEAQELAQAEGAKDAVVLLATKIANATRQMQTAIELTSTDSKLLLKAAAKGKSTGAEYAAFDAMHNTLGHAKDAAEARLAKAKNAGDKDGAKAEAENVQRLAVALAAVEGKWKQATKNAKDARVSFNRINGELEAAEANTDRLTRRIEGLRAAVARVDSKRVAAELGNYARERQSGIISHDQFTSDAASATSQAGSKAGLPQDVIDTNADSAAKMLVIVTSLKTQTDDTRQAAEALRQIIKDVADETRRMNTDAIGTARSQFTAIGADKRLGNGAKATGLTDAFTSAQQAVMGSDYLGGLDKKTTLGSLNPSPNGGGQFGDKYAKLYSLAQEYYTKTDALSAESAKSDGKLALDTEMNSVEELKRKMKNKSIERDAFISGLEEQTNFLKAFATTDANVEQRRITLIESNDRLLDASKRTWAAEEAKQAKAWQRTWEESTKKIKESFTDEITDLLMHHTKGMKTMRQMWSDVLGDILKNIIHKFVGEAIDSISGIFDSKPKSQPGVTGSGSTGGPLGALSAIIGLGSAGSHSGGAAGGAGLLGGVSAISGILGAAAGLTGHAASSSSASSSVTNSSSGITASSAGGGGFGTAVQGAGAVTSGSSGLMAHLLGSGMSGGLTKALPVIGAVLAAASILSALGAQKKPDYVNSAGKYTTSKLSSSDYTSMIDSGYSGVAGMRALNQANTDAAIRAKSSATAQQGAVQINITGVDLSNADKVAAVVAGKVGQHLASQTAISNAALGYGS